jgi:hypothetical protein
VKKKQNKRKSNMRRAVHALQQKHPFFIFFPSLSLFFSLSFDIDINGAHQQLMITIGAPPMPLVVTPSQVPSCRNVGWVS